MWNIICEINKFSKIVILIDDMWYDEHQSKEMDREKNLALHGTGEDVPAEMAGHPVFLTNQKTNSVISKKRSKVSRKKNWG